jgi:hypothetical protein
MITNWDLRTAAKTLDIDLVPFWGEPDEARGMSMGRKMAIRPGEPHPVFIALHEMAHIVLGHTAYLERFGYITDNEMRLHEVEAHAVALTAAEDLNLVDGVEFQRHEERHYLIHFGGHNARAISQYLKTNKVRLADATAEIVAAGLVRDLVAA